MAFIIKRYTAVVKPNTLFDMNISQLYISHLALQSRFDLNVG